MSQAARSHATRLVREREKVSRFLIQYVCATLRTPRDPYPPAFDVHTAREAAQSLILYGRHWRRVARRLESPKHAVRAGPAGDWADQHPGEPWPQMRGHDQSFVRLGRAVLRALEGQPSECQGCDGAGELTPDDDPGPGRMMIIAHGPVKIVGENGEVREADHGERVRGRCQMCHGTGHNLRGVLPALEVSPQLRRRYFDSLHAAQLIDPGSRDGRVDIAHWMRGLQKSWIYPGSNYLTRVVPRGEHRRHVTPHEVHEQLHGRMPRPPITYRLTGNWAPMESMSRRRDYETTTYRVGYMDSCQPRWRRGELMHAEQRRARGFIDRFAGLSPGNMTEMESEHATMLGLQRAVGETDAELRTRILALIRGQSMTYTADEADDFDPDASMDAALAFTDRTT